MIYNFFPDGTFQILTQDTPEPEYPVGTYQYDDHDAWQGEQHWWYQNELGIFGFAHEYRIEIPNEIKVKLLLLKGNV